MTLPEHIPVIIVGAGPSGLMMAAQLLRQGLHPIIIDSKTSPTSESRALVLHARSLEILRQLEIADEFLKEGNIAKVLGLQHEGEEVGYFDISGMGSGKSPFPYVLILPQSKTERILLNYLTSNACPVFWNVELLDVHQTEERVFIKYKQNGVDKYITSDWLIGADGSGSKVRKSLKIPFSGGTYKHQFYVADLAVLQGFNTDTINISYTNDGFAAILPLGNNIFRFIGILPETLKGRKDITFEDVKPYLTYTLNYPVNRELCHWVSTYQLHHRAAQRFHERRCFLVGDAAHIHSPVGGQGMNTGLQDAYNLSWKLSGVVKNEFDIQILKSYSEERMPIAHRLLKTTDRLFTIAVGQNWVLKIARNFLLPIFAKRLWKSKQTKHNTFSLLSQTGIHYRKSLLSVHHSYSKRIQAGDRLPYLNIYDEKHKTEIDLHEWCSKTGFTLVILGKLNVRSLLAIARWIKLSYPFNLNLYYLPPSKRNQNVFDCFEIKEKQKKAIIVRPDMYIGYINDVVDVELIDGYLKQISGKPNS